MVLILYSAYHDVNRFRAPISPWVKRPAANSPRRPVPAGRSPEALKLLLAAAGGVALEVTGVGLDALFEAAP